METAREEAKRGMKALREKRTKELISQQLEPYNKKHNIKQRLNKDKAVTERRRKGDSASLEGGQGGGVDAPPLSRGLLFRVGTP